MQQQQQQQQQKTTPTTPAVSILEAVLERITYANEETGYTVARVAPGRALE